MCCHNKNCKTVVPQERPEERKRLKQRHVRWRTDDGLGGHYPAWEKLADAPAPYSTEAN